MRAKWHIPVRCPAERALRCALAAAFLATAAACSRNPETTQRSAPSPQPAGPAAPASTVAPSLPKFHALVIGISDYDARGGKGWEPLVTARKDAEAVAQTLEQRYGFSVRRLMDKDATRAGIVTALDDLVKLSSNDAVMIYFAGHGYYDDALGEGYWIPSDARQGGEGAGAKADWIWNSMITKIIAASQARHILVVADACYSGSLFRGGATPVLEEDFQWYARAIRQPSRYLITSGDLEPVLDSGERHSVFAQALLNFLEHGGRPVFSASDIGFALREKVSALTGQLVRMGPLAVAAHGGGEFVFVSKDVTVEWPTDQELAAHSTARGAPVAPADEPIQPDEAKRNRMLKDAVMMKKEGAAQAAGRMASELATTHASDLMARAVADYVQDTRRDEDRREIQELIGLVEARTATDTGAAARVSAARPRIVACLGPTSRYTAADGDALAQLARICLRARLEQDGTTRIVEREALNDILREMNLATSELSDKDAGLQVGKLLPASLLLLGDLVKSGEGFDLYMRLVDTETSRILASFMANVASADALPSACEKLAIEIADKAKTLKPLSAPVLRADGDRLEAALGRFHGIAPTTAFALVLRVPGGTAADTTVGKANPVAVGDTQSAFTATWTSEREGLDLSRLWIVETAQP